jgi:small subunit ribosomal protein S20
LATHKSAEKRARQTIKKNARNVQTRNTVKTVEKKVREALTKKDTKGSQELLKQYSSTIAKAAKKGALNKKTASRKISRLSAQIAAAK